LSVEKAEKMWYLDHGVRMQKQVFSLNQIWRFLEQELECSGMIKNKLKNWSDSELSDPEEENNM